MSRPDWQHVLSGADVARIRGIADQMDLMAYLVSHSAAPAADGERIPRAVDLQLPAPGLDAMLRSWSETLAVMMDRAVPAILPPEPQS